jgi:hypothetical protein
MLFALILYPATMATADTGNRPFWTEQAIFHFGEDVFFTGRASCAPSVEEGRQRAYTAALQEIKNYSHVEKITGFLIDTQMVYEESHPVDCPVNSVTAWRLLRASRAALESLVRRSASGYSGRYITDRGPESGDPKHDSSRRNAPRRHLAALWPTSLGMDEP